MDQVFHLENLVWVFGLNVYAVVSFLWRDALHDFVGARFVAVAFANSNSEDAEGVLGVLG